jgi:RNA polymerase sigma factor (sigma-70 family)
LTSDVAVNELGGSYAALFRELRRLFHARGLSADESSDLAQETILRAIVHLRRHGRTRDDVGPLVRTIARNLLVTRVRHKQVELVPLTMENETTDAGGEPLDEILQRERREIVHIALRSLSPRHRRVVALWMQGLTPQQISRELGIKRNAADAVLHRARRRLASMLDGKLIPGIIGLALLRLRSGLARVADGIGQIDRNGSLAQASGGLAVVIVTSALLVTGSVVGSKGVTSDQRPGSITQQATVEVKSVASTEERHSLETVSPPTVSEAREYHVTTPTVENPTNEDERIWLDFSYEPEYGDQHLVDSILAPAVDATCGPVGCAKGGSP